MILQRFFAPEEYSFLNDIRSHFRTQAFQRIAARLEPRPTSPLRLRVAGYKLRVQRARHSTRNPQLVTPIGLQPSPRPPMVLRFPNPMAPPYFPATGFNQPPPLQNYNPYDV